MMYVSSTFYLIAFFSFIASVFSADTVPSVSNTVTVKPAVEMKQPQNTSMKLRGSKEKGQQRTDAKENTGAISPVVSATKEESGEVKIKKPAGDMNMLGIQKQIKATQKRAETENKKLFNGSADKKSEASDDKDLPSASTGVSKQQSNRRKMKEEVKKGSSKTGKGSKTKTVPSKGSSSDSETTTGKGSKTESASHESVPSKSAGNISSNSDNNKATGWVGLQAMTAFFVIIAAVGFALFIRPITNNRSGYQPL